MAYPEVLFPPSVKPVSPVEFEPIDDQTVVFTPQFARGLSQRQTWGDPIWGIRLRYQALAQDDRALIKAAISEARGKGANVRFSPGVPPRGSFPATELFTNNTFANGATGWTATRCTLTSADRVLRLTNTKSGGAGNFTVEQSGLAVTQYAAYAVRSMISAVSRSGMTNGTSFGSENYSATGAGLVSQAAVQLSTTTGTVYPGLFDATGNISVAGDYAELSWASLARCIQVDGGANLLLQSDAFNTTWAPTRASITANSSAAPDGTTTADTLTEDGTAANTHYVSQSVTVASAAADYTFGVAVKASGRSWVAVSIAESTSGTEAIGYFNLSSGAAGSVVVGANWASGRSHIVAMGDGWYFCSVTARKTNAATAIVAGVYAAEADGDRVFNGTSSASLLLWRATMAQSGLPTRLVQSTSAAVAASSQTGGGIYVKGLPASTSGLLLAGDYIEINGELKRVTAPLDSDAAGRGYLKFRPGLAIAAADNDPVIVNNPMGRFMIVSVRETERFGLYTDFDIELVEAPA